MISTLSKRGMTGAIVLGVWLLLSHLYPPVMVPGPGLVLESLGTIFTTPEYLGEIGKTMVRLAVGMGSGIALGCVVSFLFSRFPLVEEIFYPIVQFLQVMPPVTWLVLAIIWFGFGGTPAMFIVALSVFPVMTISLTRSFESFDKKLLQVAKLYHLSQKRQWKYIKIPIIYRAFETAVAVCFGMAFKLVVMAELLTTDSGIGGQISLARINIETEYVLAWSIVLVIIHYLIGGVLRWIKKSGRIRQFWFQRLSAGNLERTRS